MITLINVIVAATVRRHRRASRGSGFVTRFAVRQEFLQKYPKQKVGGVIHEELWIPSEDLAAMNDNIVGLIEVVAVYGKGMEQ